MSHIQKSEQIYHKCFTKDRDGTNKLIQKGKACITPTSNPFWKYPEDVHSGVRTYLQEKNQKKLKVETTTNTLKIYIYSNIFIYIYMVRSGRFRSSYIKRLGRILRSALINAGFLILFIVNNGNILTDGCRYRRRLN